MTVCSFLRSKEVKAFKSDREYLENEVTEILLRFHNDCCTIRRDMIAEKLMERSIG